MDSIWVFLVLLLLGEVVHHLPDSVKKRAGETLRRVEALIMQMQRILRIINAVRSVSKVKRGIVVMTSLLLMIANL